MIKKIVVCSRFNYSDFNLSNRYNHTNPLDPEWIKNRMKIFMNYTRKSLEGQTNQNFIVCLSTYEQSMPLINELLKEYPPLPDNIIFTPYKDQIIANYIKDSDLFYRVHIDSDDMYPISHIENMHNYEASPSTSCLICQNGYIYSVEENLLATYNNISPPFYTQIFLTKDYLKVYQYYPEHSHSANHQFPYESITGRNFIVIVHGDNIWNSSERFHQHKLITNNLEIAKIKKNFNLL